MWSQFLSRYDLYRCRFCIWNFEPRPRKYPKLLVNLNSSFNLSYFWYFIEYFSTFICHRPSLVLAFIWSSDCLGTKLTFTWALWCIQDSSRITIFISSIEQRIKAWNVIYYLHKLQYSCTRGWGGIPRVQCRRRQDGSSKVIKAQANVEGNLRSGDLTYLWIYTSFSPRMWCDLHNM